MTLQVLQTVSHYLMLFGALLLAAGTFGAYHFGQKVDAVNRHEATKREDALQTSVEEVLAGNQELQRQLEPFLELATTRYPEEELTEALQSLASDLDELRKRTDVIEEHDRPRMIEPSARQEMLSILGRHSGDKVTILAPIGAAEAYQLTGSLRDIFQVAGWEVVRAQSVFTDTFTGVHIGVRNQEIPEAARAVARALAAAGIETTFGLQPALPVGEIEIRVGPKS